MVIKSINLSAYNPDRLKWALVMVLLLVMLIMGIMLSKSYQKDENYITQQAKTEAMATGQDPCKILELWLMAAKSSGNTPLVQDIIQAQKFLGCRNQQKRQQR